MTPQELKNSILQLAIQGKLVEQRAEEGTGRELLKKILVAKNAKDAEKGKGKSRAKSAKSAKCSGSQFSPISDDEKPFDIPDSWEWVRLGDCTDYAGKKEKILPTDINPYVWSLDLEDIEKDTGLIVVHRLARDRRITGDKVVFRKGQILYSKLRPYLKKILVAPDDGVCTPELVPFSALGEIDSRYLVIVLKSPHVDFVVNSVSYGVKMPRVGTDTMTNLIIPLPPLAEQKRIVAKIEELLPLIDRYEKAWSRLESFNKSFPVDMQKSILQMAIQGKLVEQRSEEGTGWELLEKILAAKNAKDAEKGKGKSHAKSAKSAKCLGSQFSPISDDEKPFDIPDSWEWVRLGDVGSWSAGATPLRTQSDYYGGDIPWLKTGDLNDGYVTEIPETITELALSKTSVRLNPVGSVLMAMYGATIGKLGILQIPATTNQACCACIPGGAIYNKYLFYFLKARRKAFIKMGEGGAQPNISKEKIVKALIPLPPLAEQKRIVAKLEELLPLCERLK